MMTLLMTIFQYLIFVAPRRMTQVGLQKLFQSQNDGTAVASNFRLSYRLTELASLYNMHF